MAIAIIVSVLAAAGYLSTQKASYETAATVQLAVSGQGQQQQSTPTINTDSQLVTGPDVRAGALAALKLSGAAALPAKVTATYDATRSVMTIDASAPTSAAAQSVANAITNSYVAVQRKTQTDAFALVTKNRDSLQAQVSALQKQALANPKDQLVQAQLTAIIASYSTVQQQVSAQTLVGPPATVVQSAGPGVEKSTQRAKVLALAGVVGLLIGGALALLREPFDTSVRDVERAEQISHAAVLSELPNVRAFRRERKPLPVLDKPRSPFAAGIRELRTSTQVLLADVECPVVVVTSPSPVEGKTVVAANLAASFALSGKRTVLISADMRRPQVDSYFTSRARTELSGLADLLDRDHLQWQSDGAAAPLASLAGAADLSVGDVSESVEKTLIRTQIPRLWMLPAGAVQRDPADLLAGPTTAAMMTYLRSVADVIVIDTPPVLAAADTAIVASVADGVLLVARVSRTDSAHLTDSVRRLESSRAPLLGLVLNRSRTQAAIGYRDYYVDTPMAPTGAQSASTPDAALAVPAAVAASAAAAGPAVSAATASVAPAGPAVAASAASAGTASAGPTGEPGNRPNDNGKVVRAAEPAVASAGAPAMNGKPSVDPSAKPAEGKNGAASAPAAASTPEAASTHEGGTPAGSQHPANQPQPTDAEGGPPRLRIISAVKVAGAVTAASSKLRPQNPQVPVNDAADQQDEHGEGAERAN